jgi:Cu-Zn family superoxide dismutase
MKKISVLLLVGFFALSCQNSGKNKKVEKSIEVKMEKLSDTLVKATVTINETKDGENSTKEFIYKGTEESVREKVEALTESDKGAEMDISIEKQLKISLNAKSGSATSGMVTLTEADGKVTLEAHINGLQEGTHAIHLHEKADCSAENGSSAGGHWNPTFENHGAWGAAEGFHRGDIGNFTANSEGHGMLTFSTDLWCIGCDDPNKNILGKAVIVHQGEDDLISQPSGAAGARVSCAGIITE